MRNLLFEGTADAWLANERLSIGSAPTYATSNPSPIQEDANQYAQAIVGKLLDRNGENMDVCTLTLFIEMRAGKKERWRIGDKKMTMAVQLAITLRLLMR